MIWFNIKKLEKILVEENVSDKLVFDYMLTHLVFTTVAYHLSPDDPLWAVWVHLLISLIAVVWGVRKTFEINREGDNREYFKRFISISFVTGIRVVVFSLIVSFVIVISHAILKASGLSLGLSSFQEEVMELAGYLILIGVYYYMLITSFRRVNSVQGAGSKIEAV